MNSYTEEQQRLDRKLDELFPKRVSSPALISNMTKDLWSSRIERLTKRLREIDQAQIDSAARAWRKGII